MMTQERLQAEITVLKRHLPSNMFRFMDMNSSKPYLVIAARTNNKRLYTLRIELRDFPTSVPKAFVTIMLADKHGNNLNEPSASMHTLSAEDGRTRICHYGSNSWNANVSLYKVYIKCLLWLNMYEVHLVTGKDIDHYLKHQN